MKDGTMIASEPATDALKTGRQTTDDNCVPCEFVTGIAGTGKSFEMIRRVEEDSSYGKLTATTGIAAVNLGTVTLNSELRFFDTESLQDNFIRGFLQATVKALATGKNGNRREEDEAGGVQNLVIDEVSMMDGVQLDVIHNALEEVNRTLQRPLGIVLTGDFCQLPPIKAPWAFDASCWSKFAANTTRLTKNWRQGDGRFLDALNLVRSGKGKDAAEALRNLVEFAPTLDTHFDGTTLVSKNVEVDRFNAISLARVQGPEIIVASSRWGKERGEWKNIPQALKLKVGAYVMILSNDTPDFTYVNGDCGHVKEFDGEKFWIKLVRTGETVGISTIERFNEQRRLPDALTKDEKQLRQRGPGAHVHYSKGRRRWILGSVTYYPLRLAYASTVHKSQGLSLDRVQVDCRARFFGSPAMAYVSVSRARTPEGLRIVGTPEKFAAQVKVAPEVLRWL